MQTVSTILWTAVESAVFGVSIGVWLRDRQYRPGLRLDRTTLLLAATVYLIASFTWTWTTEGTSVRHTAEIGAALGAAGILWYTLRLLALPLRQAFDESVHVADRPESHQASGM